MTYFVKNKMKYVDRINNIFGSELGSEILNDSDMQTDEDIIEKYIDNACPLKLLQYGFSELIDVNKIRYKKTFIKVTTLCPELMDYYDSEIALVKFEQELSTDEDE